MKNCIRLFALSVLAASAAYSAPFLAVGDGAELFLTGTLGVRADDNIFLQSTKVDDVIFDIAPGVDLTFGKGSITQGHFSYVETISRYSQNSDLNTELAALNFASNYNDGKNTFNAAAGYNQLNQNTVDIRGATLIRRDVTTASANVEVSASAKSKVGVGAAYSDTDYKPAGFSDLTTFEVPLNYYYAVTSKVDMSVGFKYRKSEVQGAVDSNDYLYRVGARGEFTPKVNGSLMVGYGQRDLDSGGDKSMLNLEGVLNIALTAKSTLQLNASNDFGVAAAGNQQKTLSLGGVLISKISDQLQTRLGLTYLANDYYTRTDDYIEAQVGVDYTVSNNITISGAYAHRNNSSDISAAEFNNNVFSLSANFRY